MARKRRSRKRRGMISRLLRFFHIKTTSSSLWTTAFVVFGFLVILFYILFLSPYAGHWRGLFGDTQYPEAYNVRGIDVSHHQGHIDWRKVGEARIDKDPVSFVFMKATEGCDLVDNCFKENFRKSRQYGLFRGVYHFFNPKSSAILQARNFIRTVKLEEGDLPPVLDIEIIDDVPVRSLRDSALVWLKIVEQHYGVKPILYTNYSFRRDYLDTPAFDAYPYWIAHYYVEELQYKGKWHFWQHTDRGKVSGIDGYVDLNCYNGTLDDLRRFVIR